ncbi:MAG TPA: DMT family transporter, partial [Bacteroidales bacterium]|nr:DMT family transporter [Bacteroidales bacterium]
MRSIFGTYWPALLAVIFWGLSYVWSTICFQYYSPLATIFLRLLTSSLILLSLLSFKGISLSIKRSDLPRFLLTAFFSPFIYFLGENYGLALTTPTTTAVVVATIPLFTPFAAWLVLKERLGPMNVLGIGVSFGGILWLLLQGGHSLAGNPAGILLLLLGVAAAVGYTLTIKKLAERYSPIFIITWQNIMGMLYFLPLFLWFDVDEVVHVPLNPTLVVSLLSLAVFASTLAFIFWVRMLQTIGAARTSVMANLIPAITALAAFLMGQEHFDLPKLLALAVVMGGVVLSQA